jgi:hypothetical protein
MNETRITMNMSEKEAQILFVFATAGIASAMNAANQLQHHEKHKVKGLPDQVRIAIDLMSKAVEHVMNDSRED